MEELEFMRVYLDDLLVISIGTYEDHLENLDEVLFKLKKAGVKVNLRNSFLACTETDNLRYGVTKEGIKPQPKKITAMLALKPPKTVKQLKGLLGMVQYYRSDTFRRSSSDFR